MYRTAHLVELLVSAYFDLLLRQQAAAQQGADAEAGGPLPPLEVGGSGGRTPFVGNQAR